MKIYAVGSMKGGVGKTTITGNLGLTLGESGRDILLVDGDMATGALTHLFDIESPDLTLQDLISGSGRVRSAIQKFKGSTDLLPAGSGVEDLKKYMESDPGRISKTLSKVKTDYDYILIDTPPGLTKHNLEPFRVADNILMVVTPDATTVSLAEKLEIVSSILETEIFGSIINKVESGSFLDRILGKEPDDLEEIGEELESDILGRIPYDKKFIEATKNHEPLVLKDPDSDASKAFKKISESLPM